MCKSFKFLFVSVCLLAVMLIQKAGAIPYYYWDPQGTSAGNPYTGNMTGVWENSLWSLNNSAGSSPTVAWADGSLASFGVHTGNSTPAYTVTMNSSHNVAGVFNGLNAAAGNVTINGSGPLNISGDQGFYTYSGGLTTIDVPIGNTGRVVVEGPGVLSLNGTNTYTGGTTLGYFGGTTYNVVGFNNGASFGTGPITMVSSGGGMTAEGTAAITIPNSFVATNGTLNIAGNVAGITFSGGWNLGQNVLDLSISNASALVIISGVISGTGNLNKYNTGTLRLNGANTYSGSTTITNGTLALGVNGSINSSTNLTMAAGGTFDVTAINSYTLGSATTLLAAGTGTASTTAANLKGSATSAASLGSQPIILNFTPTGLSGDIAHPSLYVSQGVLALSNNPITISNLASSALGLGTYRLIQVGNGSSGTLAGTPNPAVTILGKGLAAGMTGALVISSGNLNLVVKRAPVFSTLTNTDVVTPGIGVTSVTLAGRLSAAGPVYPAVGESVGINLNGTNMTATIADYTGDFSMTFAPTNIPYSTNLYPLTVSYAGDVSIASVTNSSNLVANAYFIGGAAAGFFSGENMYVTNTSGIPMYTWSTTNVGLPVINWNLEGQMQEQPLNDGSGNSRYSINVTPSASLVYYLIGPSVNWPYANPTSVQWVTTDDSGNYYYNTTNASISVQGILDLPAPPVILLQPTNETILAGQSASFNVVATGSAPLTYQWFLNTNSALPGMTNQSLAFTNASASLSGSYSLSVSNQYGTAQSSTAILQVLPPPQLTTQPVSGGFQWSGSAAPGETFLVQMATNLSSPITWITIATNHADTNGVVQFTDTNTLANTNVFYRLAFP